MTQKTVFSSDSWHLPWVSRISRISACGWCVCVCVHSLKFHLKISRNAAVISSSHLFCQPRELAIVFPVGSLLLGRETLACQQEPSWWESVKLVEKVQGQANRKLICLCLEYFIAGEINLVENWMDVPSLAVSTN